MAELAVNVQRFRTQAALDSAVADRLQRALTSSPGAIMLSGGKTPLPAYRLLASQSLRPSPDIRLFYSDERHVPVHSNDNNYRATLPLLKSLSLPADHLLRVRTELSLEQAATDYERNLQDWLDAGVPFKLGLLGLGADGHTASLFTSSDLDRAHGHFAIAVQRPDGLQAVSVTPELLTHMEELLVVVAGADKRTVLAALLARDSNLIAWRAVLGCRHVEVWCENGS